jgi:adenosylhomocysteine nucleosidase
LKTGIICPIDTEAAPFMGAISHVEKTKTAMMTVYEGIIEGASVALVRCGVCKVNAAVSAQMLITKYNVDQIIVSGTAGGMDKRVRVGDTVVSTEAVYHDVKRYNLTEHPPFMEEPVFKADERLLFLCKNMMGNKPGCHKVHFGRIVTGESFIVAKSRDTIIKNYAPLCADMETAAAAHVCYMYEVPFIAVRTIADTEKESGVNVFKKNAPMASERSFMVVSAMLRCL